MKYQNDEHLLNLYDSCSPVAARRLNGPVGSTQLRSRTARRVADYQPIYIFSGNPSLGRRSSRSKSPRARELSGVRWCPRVHD